MQLTLDNATRIDDIFYWDIPFEHYKIESINVLTNHPIFYGRYNDSVEQYLESGRPDVTCPAVFQGRFSVYFTVAYFLPHVSEVSSIEITIVQV
jgi:hypothetical protein